jgi:hypothetical protein
MSASIAAPKALRHPKAFHPKTLPPKSFMNWADEYLRKITIP